jgi:hypothetical protein
LLDTNVIEQPSTASAYSQVHLVPKPASNAWRFCVDFVQLNDATSSAEGWPIPNIEQMLKLIGDARAKFYEVVDLTAGYHQAQMGEASKALTAAFITFMGLCQWARVVPMGLKGAPSSYFQRMMANVVLTTNLLYNICEVYFDDILIHDGESEDAFVNNVRRVFERFRSKRITLNPKKVKLGLEEVVTR